MPNKRGRRSTTTAKRRKKNVQSNTPTETLEVEDTQSTCQNETNGFINVNRSFKIVALQNGFCLVPVNSDSVSQLGRVPLNNVNLTSNERTSVGASSSSVNNKFIVQPSSSVTAVPDSSSSTTLTSSSRSLSPNATVNCANVPSTSSGVVPDSSISENKISRPSSVSVVTSSSINESPIQSSTDLSNVETVVLRNALITSTSTVNSSDVQSMHVDSSQMEIKPSCSSNYEDGITNEVTIDHSYTRDRDAETPVLAGPSNCDKPNVAENVKNEANDEMEAECPVCLHKCVHPAKLPCSHIFCYLCLKGIERSRQPCPMCRTPIPNHYTKRPELVSSSQLCNEDNGETGEEEKYCWFYQGRHGGWWQFEERMSDEIEENHNSGLSRFEMMICGSMYVIDTMSFIQYPKNCPMRVRQLLRDFPSHVNKKGIAGIHSNSSVRGPHKNI